MASCATSPLTVANDLSDALRLSFIADDVLAGKLAEGQNDDKVRPHDKNDDKNHTRRRI